jgi:hypothetical protein
VAIRLQVLAVVLSDGRGDGDGLLGSGGDTSGDTPASAGGGVLGVGVARRSIGGNSGGNLGSLAGSNGTVGTLELGGGISVNGNGDGGGAVGLRSVHPFVDQAVHRWKGTYVGSGMTVVVWKLVQSALRDSMGVRPGRVPVT